jgi:hypothetical protein
MARAMLMPRLLRATAAGSSPFGTNSDTIAWKGGALSAAPKPRAKVKSRRISGVTKPIT